MTSDAHIAMKDRDETSCIGEEGDEVVGELGQGSVDVDHGLPLLDKVVPVVLMKRERQTLEKTELAKGCWNLCVCHGCVAFVVCLSCFPDCVGFGDVEYVSVIVLYG